MSSEPNSSRRSLEARIEEWGIQPWLGAVFPLILVLLSIWLYFPLLDYFKLGMEDEGDILHAAHRVYQGQFPNRDFFTIFPPLSFGAPALSWMIFGESLAAARLPLLVLVASSALLIYFLGLRLLPAWASALASGLFLCEFGNWPAWSQNWSNVPPFLLTTWLLVRHVEKPSRPGLFWSGLAVALCFLNTPQAGFIALVLAIIVAMTESDWRPRFVALGQLFAGTGLVMFCYLGIYAWNGALEGLYKDQWLSLFSQYVGFNKTDFELFPNWAQLQSSLDIAGQWNWEQRWQARRQLLGLMTWPLVTLLGHTFFYPLVLVSFCLAFHQWWTTGERVLCVIAVGQLGLTFHTFFRPDAAHLTHSRILWWLLLFDLMRRAIQERARWQQAALLTPLALCFAAVIIQAGLHRAQWTGAQHWVRFARGPVKVSHPRLAAGLQAMNRQLDEKSDRGDKIFIYPWNSLMYVLTARDNPARVDRLLPLYTPDEVFDSVFQELVESEQELKAILIFPLHFDVYLAQYPTVPKDLFKEKYLGFENRLKTRFPDKIIEVRF